MKKFAFLFVYLIPFLSFAQLKTDVLVIGGGASGVMAGIQAARLGVKVTIIEEEAWLGGMLTSAGVSAIDGNHHLQSGLWAEFKNALLKYYGSAAALQTGWVSQVMFEPQVGQQILSEMCSKEPNLQVLLGTRYTQIVSQNNRWLITLVGNTSSTIQAKIIIDATELGDVAALLGVKYDIGMDAQSTYQERVAPQQANDIIQDLTYVAVLKDYYQVQKPVNPSSDYRRENFICACEKLCPDKQMPRLWDCEKMKTYGKLQNDLYMINWPINGNDYYVNMVDMNAEQRKQSIIKAKEHTRNFVYFMQTELGWNTLGLADIFETKDSLPMIPYHRESRRIKGLARINMNHLEKPFTQAEPLYRTGIAVGDYPIDQHHGKNSKAPDLYFVPVPSFNIPLGSLIPENVSNLIVAEKSISVSNLVNGASRLQPVVMEIGQAAGVLASLAVQNKVSPEKVSIRKVQNILVNQKAYLMPYIDVSPEHPYFRAIQKIGATGILKGEGKNNKWSNETWFYPDSTVLLKDFLEGLKSYYPKLKLPTFTESELSYPLSYPQLTSIFIHISPKHQVNLPPIGTIQRGELAYLVDKVLNPFYQKIDHQGFLAQEKNTKNP
ncbi:FAD-dependent oxidoreductase [Emticicia sp. ODNR4P]|nr:FAD-dependent oxidoreductase [Emticicia sp. ODNR4P]